MEHEEHENLLGELLDDDLTTTRKAEILQELRAANTETLTSLEDNATRISKLEEDNADLILSHSKLFRSIGRPQEKDEEKEEQSFSETISLSNFNL